MVDVDRAGRGRNADGPYGNRQNNFDQGVVVDLDVIEVVDTDAFLRAGYRVVVDAGRIDCARIARGAAHGDGQHNLDHRVAADGDVGNVVDIDAVGEAIER